MRKRDGFTAVELVVAMVIIGILLTVGVVSFRSSQVNARDRERAADVQAMANFLESIYPMEIKNSNGDVIKNAGTYPALPMEITDTTDELELIFSELEVAVMTPPGASGSQSMPSIPPSGSYSPTGDACHDYYRCYTRPDDIAGTVGKYVYAPGPDDNELCVKHGFYGSGSKPHSNDCRMFSIIYRTEVDNTRVVVESKRR